MGRTLYLECFSGISGDMTAGALIDLGVDVEGLKGALNGLGVDGFDIKVSRAVRSGLDVCDFDVILEHDNHDHDMAYLYGKDARGHDAEHGEHCHSHEGCDHAHGGHRHEHRGPDEIFEIIGRSSLSSRAKGTAARIFTILAESEAKAHGVPVDKVRFHEVGAVDSIVDVLTVAYCLDALDIDRVYVSDLYEGHGSIRCRHGIIPVPVPAVVNIVSAHSIPMHPMDSEGEFVTPTGAAIVAAVRTEKGMPKAHTVVRTGMGSGKRVTDRSGILRAFIIEERSVPNRIWKLECNIDDCSGEALGYTMDRLMETGARDVHFIPVYMKKNRPAYLLEVICSEDSVEDMERVIFGETTTIGIRRAEMIGTSLKRRAEEVDTPYGKVLVKVCDFEGSKRFYPEYESLKEICKRFGIPYQEAYRTVQNSCCERFDTGSSQKQ